jgi:hypothetical protein
VTSNITTGNAIEGESVEGRGVVGRSDRDYGVCGHSNKIAGIRGSSDESRGVEGWAVKGDVVGISTTGNGVWGQTEGEGIGVQGTSKSGIGVFGKGGRLAALFDGEVEITERLKVAGVSFYVLYNRLITVENRVRYLEETEKVYQRLKILEEKVAALEGHH